MYILIHLCPDERGFWAYCKDAPAMDDSIYRLRYRDLLAFCVLALLGMGAIMVQSASAGVTGELGWHWSKTGQRDLIYVGLAVITFFVIGHLDYRRVGRSIFHNRSESAPLPELTPQPDLLIPYASAHVQSPGSVNWDAIRRNLTTWVFIVSVLLCIAVLIPHVGTSVNGSRRWLRAGPVQLQASEVGKWATVLFFAWLLAARPIDIRRYRFFLLAMVPIGLLALPIVKEDFGTTALIGCCVITMFVAARCRLWHLATVLPPLMAAGYYFVRHKEYRWQRVIAFLNPYAAPQDTGYHLIQSLLSFASGGIFGTGLGNGVQKLGYLPEDTTDFIFAIICEELGICGAMLTVVLYCGILLACWNIIRQTRDRFGKMLVFGVASMIGLQAMINIAVATVSVPPKGLPLPLISFGGTGLLITCAMLGLVYSVSRVSDLEGKI